jgi:hypothetical protein
MPFSCSLDNRCLPLVVRSIGAFPPDPFPGASRQLLGRDIAVLRRMPFGGKLRVGDR